MDGRTITSTRSLLSWLRDVPDYVNVFLKETTDHRHVEVLADQQFLAGARHAFLFRQPDRIAASYYALYPEMRIHEVGLEALHELHAAVVDAGGHDPVVIDSDDLVSRPHATMSAYCSAVGLDFVPSSLEWTSGERPEWRRTARWHVDASASIGFHNEARTYTETVETSDQLAHFAAHHMPYYEDLRARRLDVSAWESPPDA